MSASPSVVRARATLTGLTLIWGSTFVVIQTALEVASPFVLIGLRFAITAVTMMLLFPASVRRLPSTMATSWKLSLAQFLGFALQTTGLRSTTPGHSAFITALFVIVVPLIETVERRQWPQRRLLVACLLATTGIVALFMPFEGSWKHGDTLTLLSAIAFAYYIVELTRLSQTVEANDIVIAQAVSIALLAVPCSLLFETPTLVLSIQTAWVLGYLAFVCTAFTFVMMTRAQKLVSATEAAVIYTLEPVIAAALSMMLGREDFSIQFLLGALLVLGSTALAATSPTRAT